MLYLVVSNNATVYDYEELTTVFLLLAGIMLTAGNSRRTGTLEMLEKYGNVIFYIFFYELDLG